MPLRNPIPAEVVPTLAALVTGLCILDPMPDTSAAPNIPIYTMAGNHDMYSGGKPFYWLLGQLNADPALQPYRRQASYFCLRSTNWQILAFGDGIEKGSSGKPLAFNPSLYSVFQPYLGNIALWLWGHEHNVEVFNPYLGLSKGRCIGASAIPCLVSQNPYGMISNPDLQGQAALPTLDPKMMKLQETEDGAYFHNYAIITLRSPQSQIQDSNIDYYELDSCQLGPSILMG
jgi:hypothetical protein